MLFLATVAVCFISALFPVVNAEAYVGTVAVAADDTAVWGLALTAGSAQMAGKIIWYQLGRKSLDWRWVRAKLASVKWQTRLARWQHRVQGKRVPVAAFLAASALLGIPPFAVVSVLAGQLRVPFALFVLTGFVGRTLRFAAILGGISALPLP
ncbi:MAG: VTT domain-containing protein [Actinomycetota bacterium]|nr:VTT domain-containing protein [Actinomycetota bacterium]